MEQRGLPQQWLQPQTIAVFRQIAEALNEATDLTEAMTAILPKLGEALGLETAWVFRYDKLRRSFVEVGASGLPPALGAADNQPLRCGWCECQDEFVHGNVHQAVNIVRCSRLRDAEGDTRDLRFHASVPLKSNGQPLGILNVAAPGRTMFSEEALAFLETVGQQVAVAMHRAGILSAERRRLVGLRQLAEVSASLHTTVEPNHLLQYACELFVSRFQIPACGVITKTQRGGNQGDDIVAVAEQSALPSADGYVYLRTDGDDDAAKYAMEMAEAVNSVTSPGSRHAQMVGSAVFLSNARSAFTTPIPNTAYHLRIESILENAFDDIDEEILQAFAWHVAAAYENAHLHTQAVEHAHWQERRRLAADLHDAVSQRLFSAQLLATASTSQLDAAEVAEARITLERLQQQISASQVEMRGLIDALRPQERRKFTALVRDRVTNLQYQSHTQIHLNVPAALSHEPSLEVRECLLRVLDEALQNALKHARAALITVTLEIMEEQQLLQLRITDNGIGFDASLNHVSPGLGTTTLYERTQATGGQLQIHSELGSGSTITCTFPWPATATTHVNTAEGVDL